MESTESPYTSCPCPTAFSIINTLHSCDVFTTIKPVLLYYYSLKSTIKIRVHSILYSFVGFDKCMIVMCTLLKYHREQFQCPKISPTLPSCSPMLPRTPRNHWCFYYQSSFAFHIVGIIQHITFSGWFLSHTNKHLSFLHVLLWLGNSSLFISE